MRGGERRRCRGGRGVLRGAIGRIGCRGPGRGGRRTHADPVDLRRTRHDQARHHECDRDPTTHSPQATAVLTTSPEPRHDLPTHPRGPPTPFMARDRATITTRAAMNGPGGFRAGPAAGNAAGERRGGRRSASSLVHVHGPKSGDYHHRRAAMNGWACGSGVLVLVHGPGSGDYHPESGHERLGRAAAGARRGGRRRRVRVAAGEGVAEIDDLALAGWPPCARPRNGRRPDCRARRRARPCGSRPRGGRP